MTYEEMRKYIADMVKKSRFAGCNRDWRRCFMQWPDKMFADPETGVVPIVVSIAEVGNKEGTATRYDITTDQQTINEYIDNVTEEKAKARLFIQDGDALNWVYLFGNKRHNDNGAINRPRMGRTNFIFQRKPERRILNTTTK